VRESYCGLCNECHLGDLEFLETVALMREYMERFRANYWSHCFPNEEGFNFAEFHKGLNWLLTHTECPGCKQGRGTADCPIRNCAVSRKIENCYVCEDLKSCTNFSYLEVEFPDVKIKLLRRQMKHKASEHNRRVGTNKNAKR
jgi:Protein of unknown function (DUF3795)